MKVMKDEEIIRAKILFLGLVYFHSNGKFDKEEVIKKFEREFKTLELKPYNNKTLGESVIDEPKIILHTKETDGKLNPMQFDKDIKYYRSIILRELIHKFLTKRNEKGEYMSSGLHKIISKDKEFSEYIKDSKVNKIIEKLNKITIPLFHVGVDKEEFGRGANKGYTEWFRKVILKNDENIEYKNVTKIFDKIQKKLEKKSDNAIEKMKQFKDGDYNYIFDTLNVSKEVGILFTRVLDYMYIKEKENEIIKKYFKAKDFENQVKQDKIKNVKEINGNKIDDILKNIENYCKDVEIEFTQKNKSYTKANYNNIQEEMKQRIINNNNQETQMLGLMDKLIEKAYDKDARTKGKLKITEIKDIQKSVIANIKESENNKKEKNILSKISSRLYSIFSPKNKLLMKGKQDENKYKTTQENNELIINNEIVTQGENENKKTTNINGKTKIKMPKESKCEHYRVEKNNRGPLKVIKDKIVKLMNNISVNTEKSPKDINKNYYYIEDEESDIIIDNDKILRIIAVAAALGISIPLLVQCIKSDNKPNKTVIEQTIEKETIRKTPPIIKEEETEKPVINETEKVEEVEEPEEPEGIFEKYFKDGISFKQGDAIFTTSYDNLEDSKQVLYDFDNLVCDSVRVIKDGKDIQVGELKDINELYQSAVENEANLMMRLGVLNSDNSITYIAWEDVNNMINIMDQRKSNEQIEETEIGE